MRSTQGPPGPRRVWAAQALALAVLLPPRGASGVVLSGTASAAEGPVAGFEAFLERFGRSYVPGSEEYRRRLEIFLSSARKVQEWNSDPNRPWRSALNEFSDWTPSELKQLLGYRRITQTAAPESFLASARSTYGVGRSRRDEAGSDGRDPWEPLTDPLPEAKSWGHLQALRKERDQGACGSCWALAAQTAMEAHSEIMDHPQTFDVSKIIKCTPNPKHCGGAGGCRGATAALALDFAVRFGFDYEGCPSKYLLESVNATRGHIKPSGRELFFANQYMIIGKTEDGKQFHFQGPSFGMKAWLRLAENREEPLVRALVELGPVTVSLAPGSAWTHYQEGILTEESCDEKFVVSHAVVLYGYGAAGGVRYWHLRNSWGADWGERGSLRLKRLDDEEAHCGWDEDPKAGSGCDGGPPKVWVCGICGMLSDSSMPIFRFRT